MSLSQILFRAAVTGTLVVTASFIPRPVKGLEVYTSPRNADVSAAGATSVQIEAAAGVLRVEGRPGIDQVRVRGTAKSDRRNRLDDIRLIAERRGNVVFIRADMPENRSGRFWNTGSYNDALDLVIEVPVSLAVTAGDGSGDAEFTNTGALDLSDGSGELTIRGAHGDVRVTDGSGNVTIEGVEGGVRIRDGSGSIVARNVTGSFTVENDGSGNIDVAGVGGTMRVENDGSGNISVDRVAGDFIVDHDGSGVISHSTVKGSVRVPERKRRS